VSELPVPPVAPTRPHTRELHGQVVEDSWYWLRDRDDPDVTAYLEAENTYTDAVTQHQGELRDRIFAEIKSHVQETDLSVPVPKGPWEYLVRTNEGEQYPSHWRRPRNDDGSNEQLLLDENVLAGDSPYFALGDFEMSPDHDLVAYTTDHDGDERYVLRVRDLTAGEDLPDEIVDVSYGLAWSADSRTLFYVLTDDAQRPDRVMRHRLGTPTSEDVLVAQEPDERYWVGIGTSRSERFVVISMESKLTSEVWLVEAADPEGPMRVVEPRREGVEYSVAHQGERLLVTTNDGAVDFRLMEAPLGAPGRQRWTEVRPEPPDGRLEGITAFARHYVVSERRGGTSRLTVVDADGGAERVLQFDEEVYEAGPGANAEYDTDLFRFGYGSLVTPGSVFQEHLVTGERVLLKQQPTPGYDRARYDSARRWATAEDGTRIPISLVWRSDLRAPGDAGPLLLYGYGAYEASMGPSFSASRLSLLDRGVVFAIAHVRGGGEMGRRWYEQGRLALKANTFTDFIACAEHLVASGWTTPDRLAARGASAGGLLMGAVANMRPDLFAAIVAEVPFVDNVNTMLDPTIPLTVTEYDEWGNPDEREAYEVMRAYSPYENVRAADYPALLVTAGLNDPRVQYWEPAKWVAKLRATATGARPLLLKTEMGAGHGGPSGRYDAWRDEAFVLAFVLHALGVEPAGAAEPPSQASPAESDRAADAEAVSRAAGA
jgi:oligopeptidase B